MFPGTGARRLCQAARMSIAAWKYLLPLAVVGSCCVLLQTAVANPKDPIMRQIIRTPDAPRNPLYSQAVKVGRDVYVTGMLGVDPKTNVFGATIEEQVRQSLIKCQAVLKVAGASLENVVEVHGSIETSTCRGCDVSYGIDEVDALFGDDGIARCSACDGPVKPDVVLFGEMLPEAAMSQAQGLAAEAELMLCIGSSLVVHPVAGLPAVTTACGGKLAIVTKGATPYDADAVLKLEGEVDEELDGLLAALA